MTVYASENAGCLGWKASHRYGGHEVTGGLYKISVAIWIFLGLASFASVIATLQDTYSSIVWRVQNKAVQLKEMAGFGDEKTQEEELEGPASRSSRRVAPSDSDEQTEQETDRYSDIDKQGTDRIDVT